MDIFNLATLLVPNDDSSTPTVVIETESKNILIKEYDAMVVCISYKNQLN